MEAAPGEADQPDNPIIIFLFLFCYGRETRQAERRKRYQAPRILVTTLLYIPTKPAERLPP